MTAPNGRDERRVARMEREIRIYRPLKRLFLVDVFTDKTARPNLIWAATTLLLGMLVYHWLEGWSYLDALYFCVITLATVGYGDFHPTTDLSRLFTIIYVINGIGILLALFDRIRVVRARSIEQGRAASPPAAGAEAQDPD